MTMHSWVFVDGTLLGSGFEAAGHGCGKFGGQARSAALRRRTTEQVSLLQPEPGDGTACHGKE